MTQSKSTTPELTEALLAKIVGIYYKECGWELFPEVHLQWFNGRPDYVGVKDSLTMAVECKKTLSYEVLEQLFRWRHIAIHEDLESEGSIKGIPNLLVAASFVTAVNGWKISELKSHLIKSNRFGYITVQHKGPVINLQSSVPNPSYIVKYKFDKQMHVEVGGHR